MTTKKTKNGGSGLEPDEIVERLVQDPANPQVRKLVGRYLGKGTDDAFWRLYMNESLSHYIEFKKDDTIDAERVASGALIVWLKPETSVTETRKRAGAVEFLQGEIYRDNIGKLRDPILDTSLRTVLATGGATCAHSPCPPPDYPGGPTDTTIGYTCAC